MNTESNQPSDRQEYWVCRDLSGILWLTTVEPEWVPSCNQWAITNGTFMELNPDHFREVGSGHKAKLEMNLIIPLKTNKP